MRVVSLLALPTAVVAGGVAGGEQDVVEEGNEAGGSELRAEG